MEPRRPGRPTECTREVCEAIAARVRRTGALRPACIRAGITAPTFYNWLARLQRGEEPYASLVPVVLEARAIYQGKLLRQMRRLRRNGENADGVRLRALQWELERLFPDDFGTQRLEVSGPEAGPVQVSTDDAVSKLLGLLSARAQPGGPGGSAPPAQPS